MGQEDIQLFPAKCSTVHILSTIKDWDLLHQRHFCVFAKLLCSAGSTNENEFHTSSSPTLCASNVVTSG